MGIRMEEPGFSKLVVRCNDPSGLPRQFRAEPRGCVMVSAIFFLQSRNDEHTIADREIAWSVGVILKFIVLDVAIVANIPDGSVNLRSVEFR
jgi:hypothetical protein